MREHQITPTTPVYMGVGRDNSDMFVFTGPTGAVHLAHPATGTQGRATAFPVRILPGDILNIDGIGRYQVQPTKGPLEPRLTPAA